MAVSGGFSPEVEHAIGDLFAPLQAIQNEEPQKDARQSKAESSPSNVVHLPRLDADVMGIPNAFLRSALFGVVEKGERAFLKRASISAQEGISIRYTGQQLDQADMDVWHGLLMLSKDSVGSRVYLITKSFLRFVGRSTGAPNRDWLKQSIERMTATLVEIRVGQCIYGGSLIEGYYLDQSADRYVIVINPKLTGFFAPGLWSSLSLSQRSALRGKQLAQWLHGFYSTHRNPFPYRLEKLKELSGSKSNMKSFRFRMKKYLADLSAVTGWKCDISDDVVSVVKRTD